MMINAVFLMLIGIETEGRIMIGEEMMIQGNCGYDYIFVLFLSN